MVRREILRVMGSVMFGAILPASAAMGALNMDELKNYGIIGQMKVVPGKREELIVILAEGTKEMPGNISYVISKDLSDENAIWITEYWESKEAHTKSLQLETVQAAIGKGREMIEGFGHRFEVLPASGI